MRSPRNRAAGVRAGRIDRENADGFLLAAKFVNQSIGQRALARAGRAGDADDARAAGVRKQFFQ